MTGVTAGLFPWTWQHEQSAVIAAESQDCATARQQSGRPVCPIPSRQADAGIAAQKTTTDNISNAPFLLPFMVYRSRKSIVSIPRGGLIRL